MRQFVLLGMMATSVLPAQTTLGTGAVGGKVGDQSGGYVAGARVFLTEKSKRLVRESTTNSSGSFLFPAVITGVYSLQAEKIGFKTYDLNELSVPVGKLVSLPITLVVGDVSTAVIVTAPSSTQMDRDSNAIGSMMDSKRVQELPLNGRDFLQLALLAGGSGNLGPANDLSSVNVGPPSRTVILPGTFPYSTGYSLNGINLNGSRDGELAVGISIAAIDQFNVQQSFLLPDQGQSGGLVNIATKSGGNQFHGEAFEYLKNRVIDARSFFAAAPEDLKRNQFGFALGGPIWRNKLWFYGFYEGTRELSAFSASGYSPTQAMFDGNFARSGQPIYDPESFIAGSDRRLPFPSNTIPASRINPVASKLLQYYLPGSSLSTGPANVFASPRNTLNDDQGGLRIDAALSHHQMFLQLFDQSTPVDKPGLYPLSGMLYTNKSSFAMGQDTWSLGPQAVNTLQISFLRAVAVGGNEAQSPLLSSVGILNAFGQNGISTINLQGYSSFGNAIGNVGNRDNTWQINEEFSYVRGKHAIALGGGLRLRRGWEQNANRQALGALSFQPVFTAQLAQNAQGQLVPLANTGNAFADFLLGLPISGTLAGLPAAEYRAAEFTPFAQDTWKMTSQLTLNYGVSWFVETPPDPQGWAKDAVHGFDPKTGQLTFAALGQISPQVISTDWNNISPRVGVAWKPAALTSTVFRAGIGIYYSQMPWVFLLYPLALGSPTGAGVSFANPQTNPVPAYQLGQNVFPPAPAGPPTSSYAASLLPNTTISALDPAFRTGYATQWNFSIQQMIGKSDAVEFSYLGSSSHRLPVIDDISQCRPAPDLFCDPNTKRWPQYSLIYHATSSGNSSYEAGVVRYSHRVSDDFHLHVEYAFAKALTDAWESSTIANAQITDCRRCNKGPASFDVRSRAVASLIWEPPLGRGPVTGGWSLSAITTFATGQPIVLTGPNQTNTQYLNHLPNRVCDGRSPGTSGDIRMNGFLWFNPACFQVPPPGYFGSSGATVLTGPGRNQWDLAIAKSIPLKEHVALQVRIETFNTWNHTQFQQPDGNVGDGPNFGRISATFPPRVMQLAAKLSW